MRSGYDKGGEISVFDFFFNGFRFEAAEGRIYSFLFGGRGCWVIWWTPREWDPFAANTSL